MPHALTANIKRLRRQKSLTQDALAKRAKLNYNTLVKIESNPKANPTLSTLLKLSKALRVSLDDLTR